MASIALIGGSVADTWNMHDGRGGWMAIGMIGMALIWGALILALV